MAPNPVAVETVMNRSQKFLFLEWFHQKFDRARFHRPRSHGNVAVSRNKDDRYGHRVLCEYFLKFEAIDSGKPHIQHEATGGIRSRRLPELFRRSKHQGAQSYRF